jgi:glycosyltransferase involved in cell wall biosynthesis
MRKVVLFVTYTMAKPIVGGAFIRAVRVAGEMAKRGWHPVIANWGPLLDDPKVEEAKGPVEFVLLDRDRPGLTQRGMQRQFAGYHPAIVVMGEGPFPAMELFYKAARNLDCPFIVLDQFYNHELMPWRKGVDLALLYGLASVWGDELRLEPPYEIVSPFIETVTPQCELPVPERLHGRQWITLVAYDDYVCQRGFELLARLDDKDAAIVAISRDPETCSRTACFHDIDSARLITLPLQSDANVFGFFAASAVTLVSNGFLQIMEALAMASPVIALERGEGVGMTGFNIDQRFVPYVSFEHNLEEQAVRLNRWLKKSPISAELRARLTAERHGLHYCVNRIEAVYRHSQTESKWRRAVRRWRGTIAG